MAALIAMVTIAELLQGDAVVGADSLETHALTQIDLARRSTR